MALISKLTAVVCATLLTAAAAQASDTDLLVKESKRSVKDTLDTLATALEQQGIKVVARVDHAAGAKSVGEDLRPTEVLIFANPKLGTKLMQADQRIGLDLPLKALAWQDSNGRTWLAVTKPDVLKARYAITGQDAAFATMAAALEKMTDKAVAP